MNVEIQACAPSHGLEWHGINWAKATQNVRRLQARIVKATQEGRWNKVKVLQHLLTHSLRIPAIVGSDSADRGHPRKAYILVTAILCLSGHDGSTFAVSRHSRF
ncbi:reverse transcriptase N-terminal domain-containing protein [Acidithiobacillus caldus]|uniref:reverse transcriptase N-terminal domain-containing protein n=1 Tax=Acidithiobacillus caldus TaxID=33059 RepID=UPI001D024534|nr:reverse transcriptase N-terminal domain-containing protein [Acidithiobacillus caldus]